MMDVQPVSLSDAARERYLSYALSVITSRALPDVRDGLKPVQRRILYTMFHELALHPGGRFRKCAAVVGEVMGKYHPHGDQSIYDALVRMAQDFSLRAPLVEPQGNFGSLDGDPPAAMRYTECKLAPIAEELLQEIRKDTVDVRPTYDGQRDEPVVLPAQFPHLLVNGVEGIAVGLSTRIPPHNLGEIIDATVALIDAEEDLTVSDLMRHVKGPDFPTGGVILNDGASLLDIYETGQGSVRIRGEWTTEKEGRRFLVVITSIPYAVNKAKLVEVIGQAVAERKLPQVTDVRDESTDIVRVVLELKSDASAEAVMAWIFKRTPLESTFPVYMNALVPADDGGIPTPERLDLKTALRHWLDFRYETIRRRFVYDLAQIEARIHVLEGFAIIFADLDEAIRLIRASDGRKDAARRLIERFSLSEIQADAILDLRLYKLARLEIQLILDELAEKRAEAAEIRAILASEACMWAQVRKELLELRKLYATPRKSAIGAEPEEVALAYDESAYIEREDAFVIVTRDGWVKRQSSFTDVSRIRVREGDEIGWLLEVDTHTALTLFGSDGSAYTMRVEAIPATTGHGKPLQTFFTLADRARIVGVVAHDPTFWAGLPPGVRAEDDPGGPYVVSVTRLGRIQRLPLATYAEPSNRNGRLFARLDAGDEVLAARVAMGGEHVALASKEGNVLSFPAHEANLLRAAGKGTTAMKLRDGDELIAYELARDERSGPSLFTTQGREVVVSAREFGGARAARGRQVIKRGGLQGWVRKAEVHVRKNPGAPPAQGGEE